MNRPFREVKSYTVPAGGTVTDTVYFTDTPLAYVRKVDLADTTVDVTVEVLGAKYYPPTRKISKINEFDMIATFGAPVVCEVVDLTITNNDTVDKTVEIEFLGLFTDKK